jgi:hypothetical protein
MMIFRNENRLPEAVDPTYGPFVERYLNYRLYGTPAMDSPRANRSLVHGESVSDYREQLRAPA